MSDDRGPIESREWPTELLARAVEGGPTPRLFGFDVEGDLARHYRFSDVLLLALTGELPSDGRSRAFEVALVFASSMSVAEAPVHAAVLARLCGARPGGVLSAASLTLAEHASRLLEKLDGATADPASLGEEHKARDEGERASVARLAELVRGCVEVPVLEADPGRDLAIVAVLEACGLTTAMQITSALVIARLTSALAEAGQTKPGDFGTYPIDTPHFEYEAPPDLEEP